MGLETGQGTGILVNRMKTLIEIEHLVVGYHERRAVEDASLAVPGRNHHGIDRTQRRREDQPDPGSQRCHPHPFRMDPAWSEGSH